MSKSSSKSCSLGLSELRIGQGLASRIAGSLEDDQAVGHILINSFTDDFVLPLEMVDTVLLVRKLAAAFGALESVLFATFVLQVSVEVVIPIVRSLTMRT